MTYDELNNELDRIYRNRLGLQDNYRKDSSDLACQYQRDMRNSQMAEKTILLNLDALPMVRKAGGGKV